MGDGMQDYGEKVFSKPKVGVSSCLLGERVRYNGGHCSDRTINEELAAFFQFFPLCPEMGIGLGTPRETLHLQGDPGTPRLVGAMSGSDYTAAMNAFAQAKMEWVASCGLDGFLLKKKSPSCGMARIPVYGLKKVPVDRVAGLFAAALMARFPHLPVEEEGRLNDQALKDNWIERVYAHHRWRKLLGANPGPKDLVRFHQDHKLTLMAHDEARYRALGPLVAKAGNLAWSSLLETYGTGFMDCLKQLATAKTHANVLYHVLGFLKEKLDVADKQELVALIENFRLGKCPLSVPLTLLNSQLRKYPHPWLSSQTYFAPYPRQFLMRQYF